jgi:hypothetical protein
MPQTEQLPADGRLHLGLLPGTPTARRESGARPFSRSAAIVFYALAVAFWVSWIVMASASAHSASCPSGKMVTAPEPGTTIATCKLSGETQHGHNGDDPVEMAHAMRRPAVAPPASRDPDMATPRTLPVWRNAVSAPAAIPEKDFSRCRAGRR